MQSRPSLQPSPIDRAGMEGRSVADHGVRRRRRRTDRSPRPRRSGPSGRRRPGDEFRSSARFGSPIRWVRTARNADIGSSTSMTARLWPDFVSAGAEVRPDDRGRGGRAAQQLGESLVLDERDVARARLADRPRRADRDAAVADQATANQFRKLFHRCDHGRFPFFLERRRRGPGRRGRAGVRSTSPCWPDESTWSGIAAIVTASRPARMLIHVVSRGKPSRPVSHRTARFAATTSSPRSCRATVLLCSIVRPAPPTSRFGSDFICDQSRQVRHMRQIGRPVGTAIEQAARRDPRRIAPRTSFSRSSPTQSTSRRRQAEVVARGLKERRMRFAITDFRRNHQRIDPRLSARAGPARRLAAGRRNSSRRRPRSPARQSASSTGATSG